MQKLDTTTKVYNPQTGMEAEILEATQDSVTFRSLPVGRPSTTTRAKFEAVFRIVGTGAMSENSGPPSSPEKPKKAKKKAAQKRRKKKTKRKPTATLDPATRRVLENNYRRRYYKRKCADIKKKALAHYYKVVSEIKAGIRPPKTLSPEERAKRNQYQREYRLKNPEKMKAAQKKHRLSKRPSPRRSRSSAPTPPTPETLCPANPELPPQAININLSM